MPIFNDQSFKDTLTNHIVGFEQLGPENQVQQYHTQGYGNTMPDLSNLSHRPMDKQEISMYLLWDKDFIALASKSIQIMRYFSYFS